MRDRTLSFSWLSLLIFKTKRITATATAPIGRLEAPVLISKSLIRHWQKYDIKQPYLIKKHHRHVTWSVKTPPSRGPATEAIPHIPPIKPKAAGRLSRGTGRVRSYHTLAKGARSQQYAKMTIDPEKMPPVPKPARALPTISPTLEGATPQTSEPNSKRQIAHRYTVLT